MRKSQRELILEGIEAVKAQEWWTSTTVADWIYQHYRRPVSNSYINMVRAEVGESWLQRLNRKEFWGSTDEQI